MAFDPSCEVNDGQTEIEEFKGRTTIDGALRGQMNRLGWQLGFAAGSFQQLLAFGADS